MGYRSRKIWFVVLCMLLAGGAALSAYVEAVRAEEQPTEAQILDALKSHGNTRGFGGATQALSDPKAAEERRFIDSLRSRSARSLTLVEKAKAADIARERPNIDLEINFDYDSAVVGPKAMPILLTLGRVLSKDEIKGRVFLINGHTDAKGGVEYNQDLSERRAEAVRRLLVEQFNLPATTLVAVGYGKMQLKNKADPFAGENRRVQIVNTEQQATTSTK
jgi:outer membrane protein OmpA-like peptidoglycan-associated protein